MNTIRTSALIAAAFLSLAAFGVAPARADGDDESAMQQLKDAEHSSQDAAHADGDEQAKDLSNQGFDTPNTDPAPPDDSSTDSIAEPSSSESSDGE